jgi:hypothetical protein
VFGSRLDEGLQAMGSVAARRGLQAMGSVAARRGLQAMGSVRGPPRFGRAYVASGDGGKCGALQAARDKQTGAGLHRVHDHAEGLVIPGLR